MKKKRWPARLGAIGVGLAFVVAFEVVCRVVGWGGGGDPNMDPFIGFAGTEDLFALDPVTARYETRPERRQFFVADGFARSKPPGGFRIFCLGGSTVQGRPYSTETAFTSWLRLALETARPETPWEVVNCGGVSYASYRLVPILVECLRYEPDLIVVCTGHNEFLEARTYGDVKALATGRGAGAVGALMRLRISSLLRGAVRRLASGGRGGGGGGGGVAPAPVPVMKTEVDALLDYRGGLSAYRRDDVWRDGVAAHFEENMRRMVRLAAGAGVPLVVLGPPFNLRDCPPFKSEHGEEVDDVARAAWQRCFDRSREVGGGAPGDTLSSMAEAVALSPRHAASHFALGHSFLAAGEFANARHHFTRALEEDVCPLRILPEMRRVLDEVCASTGTRFIDLQPVIEAGASFGMAGDDVLVDHVHPPVRGHQVIAGRIADELFGWVVPRPRDPSWIERKEAVFRAHLESLDELYFAHGQRRLDNLRAWTQGRSDGLPIEMHTPVGTGSTGEE